MAVKKKRTAAQEQGTAFIKEREKRAGQIIQSPDRSVAGAQRQATKELTSGFKKAEDLKLAKRTAEIIAEGENKPRESPTLPGQNIITPENKEPFIPGNRFQENLEKAGITKEGSILKGLGAALGETAENAPALLNRAALFAPAFKLSTSSGTLTATTGKALVSKAVTQNTAKTATFRGGMKYLLSAGGSVGLMRTTFGTAANIVKDATSTMAEINKQVEAGGMDIAEAQERYSELEENVAEAERTIHSFGVFRPVLWIVGGRDTEIEVIRTREITIPALKRELLLAQMTARQNKVNQIVQQQEAEQENPLISE